MSASGYIIASSTQRHHIEYRQRTVEYDAEGDVLMEDLPGMFGSESEESVEHIASTHYSSKALYRTARLSHARFSRRSYRNYLVEELTGITRVDFEIR